MKEVGFQTDLPFAQRMDEQDDLASFRQAFVITEPDLIYVDGNSLGRLPQETVHCLATVVGEEWGRDLIRGWNRGWMEAPARIGDKIAQIVGAMPGQVVVSDSTSVNLFKLVMAALSLRPDRRRIVSDELNFPSDLYVVQGCIRLNGNRHTLHLIPSRDGISVDLDSLLEAIDEETALVTLSHVTFKSSFLHDMEAVTRRAHAVGALVLWDLSHSVGVVPIALDEWGVDLAVGCTYKYLNGGPGSPAFLYVHRDLQEEIRSPIWGWLGEEAPFDFDLDYHPAQGIRRFMVGSPPILSLLALDPALDLVLKAGIGPIRNKSVLMTSYLVFLADDILASLGVTAASPRNASQRGSHVSLRHPDAYRISKALVQEMGVLPDFREPDNIRLGLAPLYNSFSEVWQTIDRIRRVIEESRYTQYSPQRSAVT